MSPAGGMFPLGGGDGTIVNPKLATGRYYGLPQAGISMSDQALALNRVYFVPFRAVEAASIDRMVVWIRGAGDAGCVARLGAYDDNNGVPGSLLFDAGTVAADSTGIKELTVSETLPAGWLYLCVVMQGGATNPSVRSYQPGLTGIGGSNPQQGLEGWGCYIEEGHSGALPAIANVANNNDDIGVMLAVRIA